MELLKDDPKPPQSPMDISNIKPITPPKDDVQTRSGGNATNK